jgi:hypothetical protein
MISHWIGWVLQSLFPLSLSLSLVLGDAMRIQVNRVLRASGKANIRIRWPRSVKETILGTHMWAFLDDLLRQHKKYYPASVLRRVFIAVAVAMFPSFVCFALGSFLLG